MIIWVKNTWSLAFSFLYLYVFIARTYVKWYYVLMLNLFSGVDFVGVGWDSNVSE